MRLSTNTAQPFLNMTMIKMFKFALPIDEQYIIVEVVNRLFKIVNELEEQVNERKRQAEELMQAILREAFKEAM